MGQLFSRGEVKPVLFPEFAKNHPSLEGKVVAITGCTSGTGFFAAKLSAQKGAHVIMLNRTSERATKAAEAIRSAAPNAKVTQIACDLSDFESVRKAAAEVKGAVTTLDVLCNNAGVMAFPDQATKDGYDIQMQTNHISHFLLTRELLPLLQKTASGPAGEARVVNHSSLAREGVKELKPEYFGKNGGNLGGDDPGFFMEGPRWVRYSQSKLANMLFTSGLHKRLQDAKSNVKSVAAAPGGAATDLVKNIPGGEKSLGWGFKIIAPIFRPFFEQAAEDGTLPLLTCMYGQEVASGDFIEPAKFGMYGPPKKTEPKPHCTSRDNERVLWNESSVAVGDFVVPGSGYGPKMEASA
mmetsp:Transcript_35072/g.72279  ORF Transcript_35072/g.72279 Transcript_35072/m.72279 type:complete len:353 (+) Transcript_35072:75-1133(+)|eukprot:CAMPEP_0181316268 /NCGR_PEP_ID=MMETSP1101-20121128/15805_1 /TAXON_ID=46948 /ORGANISM="Rhodomonas abbreviata, Strain Caron Lab Isolate" /LENGTH=352 /DNA_ID=CAMNT_0023423505 /DNA_START=55 /DNA_END=1113 /DNA_ORIENTATION=+